MNVVRRPSRRSKLVAAPQSLYRGSNGFRSTPRPTDRSVSTARLLDNAHTDAIPPCARLVQRSRSVLRGSACDTYRDDRFIAALGRYCGAAGFSAIGRRPCRTSQDTFTELLRRSDGVNRNQAFSSANVWEAQRGSGPATVSTTRVVDTEHPEGLVVERGLFFPGRRRCSASPRSSPNERVPRDSRYEKKVRVLLTGCPLEARNSVYSTISEGMS